jgi:hypothetical protein
MATLGTLTGKITLSLGDTELPAGTFEFDVPMHTVNKGREGDTAVFDLNIDRTASPKPFASSPTNSRRRSTNQASRSSPATNAAHR